MSHPAVEDISVAEAAREQVDVKVAATFQDLFVECKLEMKAAYQKEGDSAIEFAFGAMIDNILPAVSEQSSVQQRMAKFTDYMDFDELLN